MSDSSSIRFGGAGGFVGRERELDLLASHAARCASGSTSVVLLGGEPGIGKSRLLEEFADRLSHEGWLVLRGHAFEAEGMPPYLPFLQALRTYVVDAPLEALRRTVGTRISILSAILPELSQRLGPSDPDQPLPPEQARLRLFEAVAEWCQEISVIQPLALIFDNLDIADAPSHELLSHLIRHRPTARMLVLGAYRQAESAVHPSFERATTELSRLRRLDLHTIPALSVDETRLLASTFLSGRVADEVSRRLHAHSEGNAFFAEELLRDWIEAGVLRSEQDAPSAAPFWHLAGTLPASLPVSIAAAIRQRLSRLPPPVVDALRVASVIGHSFDIELLEHLTEVGEHELGERLLRAEQAGLVTSSSPSVMAFNHEKVRECLYVEVSSTRRRSLHTRIGQTLEADEADATGDRITELAYHFARSGDAARGIRYALQAAAAATRAQAPEQTLTHLQRARQLMRPDDPAYGGILLGIAHGHLASGSPRRGQSAFGEAIDWFRDRGDNIGMARASHGRALCLWQLDDLEGAEAAFRQALDLGGATPLPGPDAVELRVDASSFLGVTLGRLPEAIALAIEGRSVAQESGKPSLEAKASRSLGFLLVLDSELTDGLSLLERGLDLALEQEDLAEAATCCAALAQSYAWSGDLARSREVSLRREALSRSAQAIESLAYVYSWLGFLDAARGEWNEVERWLNTAQAAVERIPSARPAAFLSQVRGFLAFQRQDFEQAEEHFAMALTSFRTRDPMEYFLCAGMLALTRAERGDGRGARQILHEQEDLLSTSQVGRLPAASIRSTMALTLAAVGDHHRSGSLLEELANFRGQYHWFTVDRALGELALLNGALPMAAGTLEAAAQLAERQGLRPELARTLRAQAEVEIRSGGSGSAARARAHLQRALEIFRSLDCPAAVRETQHRLAAIPSQPVSPTPGRNPGRLSDREAEVLRLVAGGMTNRQIASALALSDSTVAKHLTSVYSKLGVDNRAAAAAFAIRHGLA